MSNSQNEADMRLMQHFISPLDAEPFPMVSHGDGIYLWDQDGRRYLDGSSGAVVSNIGHNNPRVKAVMREQADRITFAYARVWESPANRGLAERVVKLAGSGYDSCFFVSGGTEAIEASLKLARQVAVARDQQTRWKVISRMPSYHGSTLAVLGVTGDDDFGGAFRPMYVDMPKIPAPLGYRTPEGVDARENARRCAAALEERILAEGPDSVLAFVMEPVGGTSTGALVSPDSYYESVRAICDRHGVQLIFDEVMSGAGRTGRFLAAHYWPKCRPDIVVLAKGLSGGYAPLGAVVTSSDVVDDVRRAGGFMHGHTYAANPQSCAIACAVLDELVEHNLVENAATMGNHLQARLLELQNRFSVIGDVRGRGLLCAIEIVADRPTKRMFPVEADAIGRIRNLCREAGLVLLSRRTSGGRYGEWLMVCPPLIVNQAQVDELCDSLSIALQRFESEVAVSSRARATAAGGPRS